MLLPEYVARGANAANELRLSRELGIEPIADLWQLIRDTDLVDLAFSPFQADGPDGVYHWNGESALIVINGDKEPLARQRFTAAHELGHHLLHRESGRSLIIAEGDLQAPSPEKSTEEREADAFAGHLLAPTEAMLRAFAGRPRSEISAEEVVDLAHRFGTTFRVTVYRLHNSGRIAAADRDRILADGDGRVNAIIAAKGYDHREGHPAPLPPGYMQKVLMMHAQGAIDLARLAELLRISEDEAGELVARALGAEGRPEPAPDPLAAEIEEAFGEAESA